MGDPEKILTTTNVSKIQSELSFSNFDFAAINFQDTGLDDTLFKMVSGSLGLRGITSGSLTEAAKTLNDLTSNRVDGNVLIDAINSLSACGVEFADFDLTHLTERTTLQKLREVVLHTQVSNKVIGTLVNSVIDDRLNLYADEFADLIKDATALQEAARAGIDPTSISSLEYDAGFTPIKIESVDEMAAGYESRVIQTVGYIIEKNEYVGKVTIPHDPVIVVGPTTSIALDSRVKYGSIYGYTVKTVVAVRLPMVTTAGQSVLGTGLIASRGSTEILVQCTENTPPPHPADFRPDWDFANNQLRLLWSFPVNPQRDIKRFQIFRRKSITLPFELLGEYDFDDSLEKLPRSERVPKKLITKMINNPQTKFVDLDFDKDSTHIYALCSIDAHGLSSNYSIQFEVTFDRFSNSLNLKMISRSGAPKALPNLYLRENVFVDTMKTSGFNRMTVYFDPEYLDVKDEDGNDLSLLPLSDLRDVYKMQVINTDVQEAEVLTIKLKDLRS
ncbi:hypothetical protein HN588_10385 [Candidatus Bathyarchaeota archaeon]|nr:hypothetical protein [Candidatus Bathyarchaeota archaeon]